MEEQNSASWQAISLISDNENIYESGDLSLLSGKLPIEDAKHYAYTVASDEKGRRLQMYSELSSDKEILYLKASFDLSAAYSLRENQQNMPWSGIAGSCGNSVRLYFFGLQNHCSCYY